MSSPNLLVTLTIKIVAAYVEFNDVRQDQIPAIIKLVHQSLAVAVGERPAQLRMHASEERIRESISAEVLISFENGRPYRQLTRHLTARGLTPDAYRTKWGLPPTYPMVAANSAARRSTLAKSLDLAASGRRARPARGGEGGGGSRAVPT